MNEQDYISYLELINEGHSQRSAAKILGISRTMIQRHIKKQLEADSIRNSVFNVQNKNDYSGWQSKPKPDLKHISTKDFGSFENMYVEEIEREYSETIENTLSKKPTILVIADTQAKSEESLEYLLWIGKYIADKKPDIIVHIGDHFDLPSLSSYDKGTTNIEGKRLYKDIQAGVTGFEFLNLEMLKHKDYKPRKVFCLGNHEERLNRYVNEHPELQGTLGTE